MKHAFLFTGFANKILGQRPARLTRFFEERGFTVDSFSGAKESMFLHGCEEFPGVEAFSGHIAERTAAAEHTMAIAVSGGGFGALEHCTRAGVNCFLGFSIFTAIDHAARAVDHRGRAYLDTLDTVISEESDRNMRPRLASRSHSTSIHLFYPGENPADRYQAENLEDLPGVTLHPQAGSRKHGFGDVEFSLPETINRIAAAEGIDTGYVGREPSPKVA
ncbi:hypothetical protein [Algicella marina]|uniref:Uncharacterized protein n=1 Tax=Algicella marina TaxID=2683284 RepID=A0A6P1T0B0_9RHOB|nr:hypothetical protein [Algicella marina]QHQ35290.1 hypothetical protein GO499_08810 [Algicella marina]